MAIQSWVFCKEKFTYPLSCKKMFTGMKKKEAYQTGRLSGVAEPGKDGFTVTVLWLRNYTDAAISENHMRLLEALALLAYLYRSWIIWFFFFIPVIFLYVLGVVVRKTTTPVFILLDNIILEDTEGHQILIEWGFQEMWHYSTPNIYYSIPQ